MSDDDPNAQRPGESDHEYIQRMTSPELRYLDLIERLAGRVTTGEAETRRRIDFILGQQASSASKLDALAEAQTRAERRWEHTEESIRGLLAVTELQSQEIRDLAAGLRAVDERQRRQADEQQRETRENLNALINTVERYIIEGRNGKG